MLAPLLTAAAPTLRALRLSIAEPLDGTMRAALRSLTALTSLRLEFPVDHALEDPWGGDPPPPIDCRLLTGMAALQELGASDARGLGSPAALAGLPALGKLRVEHSATLHALATLPGITELTLPRTAAAWLVEDGPACEALARLPGLRRLVFGERERIWPNSEPFVLVEALNSHSEALAALAERLPAGCEVHSEPPSIVHD